MRSRRHTGCRSHTKCGSCCCAPVSNGKCDASIPGSISMLNADALLDSREHLMAELAWLELRLQREVVVARAQRRSETLDEFAGMYVSDAEIDGYLSPPPTIAPPPLDEWDARIAKARASIDARVRQAVDAGVPLRLPVLVATFALSDTEADVLLFALAADCDERFARYF